MPVVPAPSITDATDPSKITFAWPCPNGHHPEQTFHVEELRAAVAAGTVDVYCAWCADPYYSVSPEPLNVQRLVAFFDKHGHMPQ